MAKKKFYSLSRYTDKTDGNTKIGYLPRKGFEVPNTFGINLMVYRAVDETASTRYNEVKTWFVVDEYCGLSIGEGSTKKEAIENAFDRLSKIDMETYNDSQRKAIEKYGYPPGHRVMYNLCGGCT